MASDKTRKLRKDGETAHEALVGVHVAAEHDVHTRRVEQALHGGLHQVALALVGEVGVVPGGTQGGACGREAMTRALHFRCFKNRKQTGFRNKKHNALALVGEIGGVPGGTHTSAHGSKTMARALFVPFSQKG